VIYVVRASSDSFEIRWREQTYQDGTIVKTENLYQRRHHHLKLPAPDEVDEQKTRSGSTFVRSTGRRTSDHRA